MIYELIYILIVLIIQQTIDVDALGYLVGHTIVGASFGEGEVINVGLTIVFSAIALVLIALSVHTTAAETGGNKQNKKDSKAINSKSYVYLLTLFIVDVLFIAFLIYVIIVEIKDVSSNFLPFLVLALFSYWLANLIYSLLLVMKAFFYLCSLKLDKM